MDPQCPGVHKLQEANQFYIRGDMLSFNLYIYCLLYNSGR